MKNQGISLISLIITIIVIIILAAIVLFNGLNAPNSANFAKFTQNVDNVSMAVMNKYANLMERHGISGETRTAEQIYLEIAEAHNYGQTKYMGLSKGTVKDSAAASEGLQNIDPDKSNLSAPTSAEKLTNADKNFSLGMALPKVRESNKAWYITKDGTVFNANGYEYDGKVYFTGAYYVEGVDRKAVDDPLNARAKQIADAIAKGDTNLGSGITADN